MQRVVDNFRNGTRFPEQQVSASTELRISCNQEFPVTEDSSVLKNFLWKSAPFIHRVCHNPPIKKKMAHVGGRPHLSRPHCDVSSLRRVEHELSVDGDQFSGLLWTLRSLKLRDDDGVTNGWLSGWERTLTRSWFFYAKVVVRWITKVWGFYFPQPIWGVHSRQLSIAEEKRDSLFMFWKMWGSENVMDHAIR